MKPKDIASNVVNKKSVPINVSCLGADEIKVAPGEGKIPTHRMRNKDEDVKAFPKHYSTGKYGLNYDREFQLGPAEYFNQRCMNKDEQFSKDTLCS